MKLNILTIDYHRNGIDGTPFHVALFSDGNDDGHSKVGIVFDEPGHLAVLDVQRLAAGDTASGSNSWRGDRYERLLRDAIVEFQIREP